MTRFGAPVRRMSDGSPMSPDSYSPTSSLHSSMGSPGKMSPSKSPSGFGSSASTGRSTGRSDKARSPAGPLYQSMGGSPSGKRSPGSSAGFGSSAPTGRGDSSAELKALRGRMSSVSSSSMTKIPSPLSKSMTRSALAAERAKLRSVTSSPRTSSPRASQSPREAPKTSSPSKDVLRVPSASKPAPPSPREQEKTSTQTSPRGIIMYPTRAGNAAAPSPQNKPQAIPGTARGTKSRPFKISLPSLSSPKANAQTSDTMAAVSSHKSATADLGTNASRESLAAFLQIEAAETNRVPQLPVSHPSPGSNSTGLSSSQESVENAINYMASDADCHDGDMPPDHGPLDPVDEDTEANVRTSITRPGGNATRLSASGSPWKPAGVLSHTVRSSLDCPLPRSPRLLRKSIDSPRSSPKARKSIESMPTSQYESRRDGGSALAVPTDSPLRKSSSSSSTDCNRIRTSSVIRSPISRPVMHTSSDKPPAALELDEDDSHSDAGSVEVCRKFPKAKSRYSSPASRSQEGAEYCLSEDRQPLHPEASISPRNVLPSVDAEKAIAMSPVSKGVALASRPVSSSIESNENADGRQMVVASTEEVNALDKIAFRESQKIENEDIGWIDSMTASREANIRVSASEDLPVHIANALDTSTEMSPRDEKKCLMSATVESTGVIEEIKPAGSIAKEARETNLAQKIQEVFVYTKGTSPMKMGLSASPEIQVIKTPQRTGATPAVRQSLRSIVPRDKQSKAKRAGWVEALRVSAVSAAAGLATNVLLRAVLKDDGRFPRNDPGIRPSHYRHASFDTFLEDSWRKAT